MGRGASLLLNLPPDRRGRIHENDARSLRGFRALLDATFTEDLAQGATARASSVRGGDERYAPLRVLDGDRDTYWSTDDGVTTPELVLDLGRPVTFNVVSLREHLPLGQRIEDWAIDAWAGRRVGGDRQGHRVGNRRLWRGGDVTTDRVRLRVMKAPVCPALSEMALFREPPEARPGSPPD